MTLSPHAVALRMLLAALLAAASACGSTTPATPEGGACDGVSVATEDGRTLCVQRLAATETGFTCPPDMFGFGGPGWAACTPDEGFRQEDVEKAVIAQDALSCGGLQLDLLFVVDSSTSMCEAQRPLADAMLGFADVLAGYDADVHVAVTSMDHQCDPAQHPGAQGTYNTTPAAGYPLSCYDKVEQACQSDADCDAALGEPGAWLCKAPPTAACATNPNGSINTWCVRLCTEDAECEAALGPGARCSTPGDSPRDWGCLMAPPTDGCAASVGPVLTQGELEQFRCVASLGLYADKCFQYEQGLRSAWSALDPAGPNPVLSGLFLRPGALLAIVFVTDEDDCSVPEGGALTEDQFATCGQLASTDAGGPLAPVSEFVTRYRSLKGDARLVKVLTVAGDSLAGTPEAVQADREGYVASFLDPKQCHAQSSICTAGATRAQLGSRYLALVEAFGEHGLFQNICQPDDLVGAFGALLDSVTGSYLDVCLTR